MGLYFCETVISAKIVNGERLLTTVGCMINAWSNGM